MKTLLVTSQYAPELGGVPHLLWLYSQHRPSSVALRVLSVQQQPAAFYTAFDQAAGFPIERITATRRWGLTSAVFLRRLSEVVRQWSPDVLFSGVAYPTAVLAWLVHRLYDRPYVVYAHSEDVTIASSLKRRLLRPALQQANAVLTVSHFTDRELQQLGVPAKQIHLVPPGIEVEPFAIAQARNQWPGQWILLSVARLVARKGQDTVIRALPQVIAQVPNVHYVIVGSGPDEAYLRHLAAEMNVADYVTFAGRVADDELPGYYQACQALIMLSRPSANEVEGFGIAFLEAGAASKPVIGGQAGGVADAIQNGITGLLLDPLDVTAAAAAIIYLAQNPTLAQQMGAAGQEFVQQQHTAATFAAKITTMLEV